MTSIVGPGLQNRTAALTQKLNELAYERLRMSRRIEEIDEAINQIEGAQVANAQVKKDLDTQAIIDAAKAAQPVEEVILKEEVPQNA